MAEIGSLLIGSNAKVYQLESELGSGGEGIVYKTNVPGIAVKIYRNPTAEIERKVRYMVSCPVDSYAKDGTHTPVIAWPMDVLSENGQFVGYAMPLVNDTIPIYTLCRSGDEARRFFKDYSWLTHLGVAFNLANTVKYLHSVDCIVGDMNSKNIVVHRNGLITFLDADSFDLTNPVTGERFPCTVGRPEFLPPELQGRNLNKASFTKESDDFSLAIHLFRLLLHNRHPYDVKVNSNESRNESRQEYNISMGNCAYVRTVPGCEIPPNEPTLEMLPDNLKEDFRRTFFYDANNFMSQISQRTSAAQWASDLGALYANRASLLQRCSNNPEHYFLKSKGVCEFCRAFNNTSPQHRHISTSNAKKIDSSQQTVSQNTQAAGSSTELSSKSKTALRKKNRRIMFWTVICLWALSLALVYLPMKEDNDRLDYRVRNLQSQNRQLEEENGELAEKADFMDDYIRIISTSDNGDRYYHRYGCPNLDSSSFLAYNVNAAKKNADPCPECCSDDSY